jgi:hypothetical protein
MQLLVCVINYHGFREKQEWNNITFSRHPRSFLIVVIRLLDSWNFLTAS